MLEAIACDAGEMTSLFVLAIFVKCPVLEQASARLAQACFPID
jgi:hypothetical protein